MKNRSFNIYDEDTIFEMLRFWENLTPIFSVLNQEQDRAYDMTVSRLQWLEEWRQAYELQNRAVSAYNLLRPVINIITAVELGNRKKVIAKPRTGGDMKVAEVLTQVLLYFFYKSKFDWHRTRVFLDSIIAKFGVYHIGWDYEQNKKEGNLNITAVDPRTIRFEPNYADPTWQKSGYIYRKHQMSLEEVINKYAIDDPEMEEAIMVESAAFFDRDKGREKWVSKRLKNLLTAVYEAATGVSRTSQDNKFFNWFDPLTGKFQILELHEKRTERRIVVPKEEAGRQQLVDITEPYWGEIKRTMGIEKGGFVKGSGEVVNMIKQRYGLTADARTELENVKFVTTVIPAFRLKVNEQPYPYKSDSYCYVPNYCYDYHADILKSQSVIDDLIDPQTDYNKARSLKLELLWKYANSGWVMDANAIDGYEQDWQGGSELAPYRRVRPGYINQIKPELHQTINPDLIRETQESPLLIKQISNAGDPMRGNQQEEKSGRHFIAKKTQEEKSFSYLFSNIDTSTVAVGQESVALIQFYVKASRTFRITQDIADVMEPKDITVNEKRMAYDPEADKITMMRVNDISVGEYDIEIDKTPYSSTSREMQFEKLAELFEAAIVVNPEKADKLLNIMVEIGDFPKAEKILELWGGDQNSPEQKQMEAIQQQIQQVMIKLGIEEKQAEVAGKLASAEKTKQEAIGQSLENEKLKKELKAMTMSNVLGQMRKPSNGKSKPELQLN